MRSAIKYLAHDTEKNIELTNFFLQSQQKCGSPYIPYYLDSQDHVIFK